MEVTSCHGAAGRSLQSVAGSPHQEGGGWGWGGANNQTHLGVEAGTQWDFGQATEPL